MDERQGIDDERLGESSGGAAPHDGPDAVAPRPQRRSVARSLTRSVLTSAALLLVYYTLPLNRTFGARTLVVLVLSLVGLSVLVALQVRSILRSRYPALRALESMALTLPLFLIIFAVVYEVLSTSDPQAFSEPLSRTDALYFVVTVFATVGFGDITAVSQLARILVTVQMVADLLLIGLVVRAVLGAVQHRARGWAGRTQ